MYSFMQGGSFISSSFMQMSAKSKCSYYSHTVELTINLFLEAFWQVADFCYSPGPEVKNFFHAQLN